MADRSHRRVLFIEDTVPLRMHGTSYLRANDIIRIMAGLEYQVTVFPMETAEAGSPRSLLISRIRWRSCMIAHKVTSMLS